MNNIWNENSVVCEVAYILGDSCGEKYIFLMSNIEVVTFM